MINEKVIVVSVKDLKLDGMELTKSIKDINWGNYTCLVFHSCIESDTETLTALTKIRDIENIKVILISRDISTLWYYVFNGLDADIYDDLDYLEDQSILEYIITNYHNNKGMCVKAPTDGVESLEKFLNLFSNSNNEEIIKTINNKLWLQSLHTAVTTMHTSLMRSNDIGTEVLSLISKTSELVKTLEEGQINTANELAELQKMVNEMKENMTSPTSNTKSNIPFIFNKYTVPLTVPKVLYIRVVGNCMHLNSFMVAYQHYLKMQKQYNSKILLMQPKLRMDIKRYSNLPNLSSDSIGLTSNMNSPLAVTFEPKKSVLDAWFRSNNKINLYIVIDYLKDDIMIDGHMVETFYGITSLNDLKRFGIKPDRAFIAISGFKNNFMIPFIPKYRDVPDQTKKAMYFEKCKELFGRLDKVLFRD